ncbi:MAG TPA: PAAR domain-containing protein [Streptosporangiaceae bacterium]|nr:PAAR domain-containing protein [Streptosporangiaceae bacterium]
MGMPAAKQGDRVTATDTHFIVTPPGPVVPVPHPFTGVLNGELSRDVRIGGKPAATAGSTATTQPPHTPNGGSFAKQPANRGTIIGGSATVRINGKPAARTGDQVMTCNDPVDLPVGTVTADGMVRIG